jgi:hypothetical protein
MLVSSKSITFQLGALGSEDVQANQEKQDI